MMMPEVTNLPPNPAALRQAAFVLLGRREYTAKELAEKLSTRFSISARSEEIINTINVFKEKQYQSDERFTEMLVRSRYSRGFGPLRIEQELRARGICAELVSVHVERNSNRWVELARITKQKRFGDSAPGSPKEKARIVKYLQGRGFLFEQIAQICRKS